MKKSFITLGPDLQYVFHPVQDIVRFFSHPSSINIILISFCKIQTRGTH